MFTDDIVICREQVEGNLEGWRYAPEGRGIKVSRSETEYMCVNERDQSEIVSLQGGEVKKVEDFKYLGSTMQSNRKIEVKMHVQTGSTKKPCVFFKQYPRLKIAFVCVFSISIVKERRFR